ncbi:MAG: hypothetical protein KC449_18310 [Anaerolineales bacterium]|nr:hypothetical protein [Anaerolineales bacterium]
MKRFQNASVSLGGNEGKLGWETAVSLKVVGETAVCALYGCQNKERLATLILAF